LIGNPARNALIAESVESSQTATALSTLITISQGMSTLVAGAGGYIALKVGYMPIFYITVVGDLIGSRRPILQKAMTLSESLFHIRSEKC
jgi:hypothetical protein